MIVQLVNIAFPDVFRRYSKKYNIFRDLYEKDLLALEVRDIRSDLADSLRKIFLNNNEMCYNKKFESSDNIDFLALGSISIFKEISKNILSAGNEDLGLRISNVIHNYADYGKKSFQIGNKNFSINNSWVMGILNVTPDSFSDGGNYFSIESALSHALKMLDDGADIIDVGGESTRPGSERIDEEEEIRRVIPVIERILAERPDTLISIDTTKSGVAYKALQTGAKLINDISGLTFDDKIIDIARENDAGLIIMHMKGTPLTMQNNPEYQDVVGEVYDFLDRQSVLSRKKGVKSIFIDPGLGFGKRVRDNYELLKRLNEFKGIGYPIVIGLSRKSFLGKSLEVDIHEREIPTVIAETIAIKNGAIIIRTHNVKNAVQAKKIINFIDDPEKLQNV